VPFDDPFRLELRAWLADNVPGEPEPLDQDERFEFRRTWHRRLAADGWVGVHWPAEFGGRAAGPLTQLMYYEELALARAPEPVNTPGIILLGPTLMALGPEDLKRRFLPGILSGEEMWCQGFSEPDSGSDLASLRTWAELRGGSWRINGQKIWTTFGQYADFCFVLCRTETGSSRHRGMSLLICPMDQPGVVQRPIRQISGEQEFCEVFFDAAITPRDWVVGEPGQGWQAAMKLFQFERGDQGFTDHARILVHLSDAAESLRASVAHGLISPVRARHAKDRQLDLWIRAQELRRLNLRAALLAGQGKDLGAVGSVTNLVWGELDKELADHCADLLGPHGVEFGPAESVARLAARAKTIYSGTSEIQRNIIAERLLGLPR
jgi:alkylation response protein AidB-like acyl-CoA dehydrogenase